eukprot:c13520_g1_i1.p1 GENE.c13520_g1_i1~~c13520_g1_i1.p1  ORF type:complete len:138 (+),score=24.40 c13520_g1_i1:38-415(+)
MFLRFVCTRRSSTLFPGSILSRNISKLPTSARGVALQTLSKDWTVEPSRDAIKRTYRFQDFKAAWAWMGDVATVAEEMNHHPEWFNVYNRVDVLLTTHDCQGLSENDIALARKMDTFFSKHNTAS